MTTLIPLIEKQALLNDSSSPRLTGYSSTQIRRQQGADITFGMPARLTHVNANASASLLREDLRLRSERRLSANAGSLENISKAYLSHHGIHMHSNAAATSSDNRYDYSYSPFSIKSQPSRSLVHFVSFSRTPGFAGRFQGIPAFLAQKLQLRFHQRPETGAVNGSLLF